ncbi:multiple organellar RNA editing factor 2, chloroplastic-like [Lotus japonicus]|uniref:multiple organellar RNA editing factor 2, chloroplastic-like n=1 Tax=Lotus japonicus TaxID=34305 RepID=UPI00258C76F6|nr:multiple organellar RNA editing factor 2, chloroplastic-like [Lotus japonicus]
MVVAMARALSRSSLRLALNLPSRRLLSSSSSAMILARRLPSAPPFPASRFTDVRFNSELTTGSPSSISEKPAAEMPPLFPGCDYNHWLIIMDKPGGEGATKKQMIDCYIKTLAKVVGSEEEAKKRIYSISCEKYLGFGCEIDEETSDKLDGKAGIMFVLPDSYVDPEYKDYGGELFVNGAIVQRPPERQKRLDRNKQPERRHERYNDKTRK